MTDHAASEASPKVYASLPQFKPIYTADNYAHKINKPGDCYGTNLDVYESFNNTDMGIRQASDGLKFHAGWVICN